MTYPTNEQLADACCFSSEYKYLPKFLRLLPERWKTSYHILIYNSLYTMKHGAHNSCIFLHSAINILSIKEINFERLEIERGKRSSVHCSVFCFSNAQISESTCRIGKSKKISLLYKPIGNPSGQNSQKTVWRSAILLTRHSKLSKYTPTDCFFRRFCPLGCYLRC